MIVVPRIPRRSAAFTPRAKSQSVITSPITNVRIAAVVRRPRGRRGPRGGRLEPGTEIGFFEGGDRVEVQDLGVEKVDVGHPEEGRGAADALGADGGPVLAKLELAFEDARRFHPPG